MEQIIKHENFKKMLNFAVEKYGEKEVFAEIVDGEYKPILYKEFYHDVNSLGTALIDLGLKDKSISLIGENRYDWCVGYMSVTCGVGIIVPLDKELMKDEIKHLILRSSSDAIIYSKKFIPIINEISRDLDCTKYFICMDDIESKSSNNQRFMSMSSLITKGASLIENADDRFITAKIDNKKMQILIFTSGTTGIAKGVMLSHDNICSNVYSMSSMIDVFSADKFFNVLPLHHTFACSVDFMFMLSRGASMYFCEGLRHIAKNLKQAKPTVFVCVPLMLEGIYKKVMDKVNASLKGRIFFPVLGAVANFLYFFKIDIRKKIFKKVHDVFGGDLRIAVTGASAMDPDVLKAFRKMGLLALQGYGLTESSPVVSVSSMTQIRDASIGLPIPDVEVKIYKPNAEGIGEIIVKGPNVMLGYYQNEEATNEVLKDGWLYTGDIGYIDDDGFAYITGRKKNIIITKNGKNVYPEEIEMVINKNPLVMESMVASMHDNIGKENYICAHIVPDMEYIANTYNIENPDNLEIEKLFTQAIKQINAQLPTYKKIRNHVLRFTEFEKTSTKKIKRHAAAIN